MVVMMVKYSPRRSQLLPPQGRTANPHTLASNHDMRKCYPWFISSLPIPRAWCPVVIDGISKKRDFSRGQCFNHDRLHFMFQWYCPSPFRHSEGKKIISSSESMALLCEYERFSTMSLYGSYCIPQSVCSNWLHCICCLGVWCLYRWIIQLSCVVINSILL